MADPSSVEAQFFRTLNGVVEPLVRAGLGSPVFWPSGFIVLECTGRRTGRKFRVPVAATCLGGALLASTVRGARSQWLKNLSAEPALTYWLAAREHAATAIVFLPRIPPPDTKSLPAPVRQLASGLSFLTELGMGFAVLTPANNGR